MIYNIQTFCTYGYWPEDLKPKSVRPIIAACDRCNKTRIVTKQSYRDLCISCAQIKRFEDPKERENHRQANMRRFNNPEERNKISTALKTYYRGPDGIDNNRKSTLKAYENDPTIVERISKSVKDFYDKMDDPGNQIVNHHYVYDFNDSDKYTIEVTRSEHIVIHNKLRYAGLQVPCINILKGE